MTVGRPVDPRNFTMTVTSQQTCGAPIARGRRCGHAVGMAGHRHLAGRRIVDLRDDLVECGEGAGLELMRPGIEQHGAVQRDAGGRAREPAGHGGGAGAPALLERG